MVGELQKKSAKLVMNLKSVAKRRDSPTKTGLSSQGDVTAENIEGDTSSKGVSQKRKQDSFLVEVQERAEVLHIEQYWGDCS